MQTTAAHEPNHLDDEYYATTAFESAINSAIDLAASLSVQPPPGGAQVTHIASDPDRITVDILFSSNQVREAGNPRATITVRQDSVPDAWFRRYGDAVDLKYSLTSNFESNPRSQAQDFFVRHTHSSDSPTLHFASNQFRDVMAFSAASTGVVSGLRDQGWRMLYFSAVTVTTLGFGDVVPVTTSSRLLVATEAVLGVIVIGLFLNAIGRQRKSSTDEVLPSASLEERDPSS